MITKCRFQLVIRSCVDRKHICTFKRFGMCRFLFSPCLDSVKCAIVCMRFIKKHKHSCLAYLIGGNVGLVKVKSDSGTNSSARC